MTPRLSRLAGSLRLAPIWLLALALAAGFGLASPFFLTPVNLSNILVQCALIGFLAAGLTPVIISGNIDLSVGATVGLTACLAVGLQPYGAPTAVLAALGAGLALGLLNGLIVETTGVNSFIVTLGAMIGIRGLAFLYAGEGSLSASTEALSTAAAWSLGPLSLAPLAFLAAIALVGWMLRSSVFGRDLYAIGGARQAAVDAGVSVSRRIVGVFGLSGLLAGVCGVAMAAKLDAATPSFGRDYELWAIIAVVLGGTRLRGGVGTAFGALAAVLALGVMRNGLNLLGVSPFLLPVIMGAALIAALAVDARIHPPHRFEGE